jgi:uncharacterized protein YbjT (DUF2867 family)
MKIVIIGGSGLIGTKLVGLLSAAGHEAVPASPATGVDAVTGEGLADVLAGADVVVDVANSPSFADDDVLEFFTASGRNLLAAEADAGVGHHVALTIVGADRCPDSGYLRAKVAQEALVEKGQVPWTIVRSTQFFEFARSIVAGGVVGDAVHLTPATLQPIAADDVAAALFDVALAPPVHGTVEIAGPERIPLAEIGSRVLAVDGDTRPVVADPHARYFGTELDDASLTAGPDARLGTTTYAQWLGTTGARRP